MFAAKLKRLSAGLCLLLILSLPVNATRANGRHNALTPDAGRALDTLPPGAMMRVIVHLDERAELEARPGARQTARVITALHEHAETAQILLRDWLRLRETGGKARDITPFWVFNGLAVTASRDVILALAARPDVARVALDEAFLAPPQFSPTSNTDVRAAVGLRRGALTQTTAGAEGTVGENLNLIGAPEAWARGITGKGVVVAVLDSGADLSHPDLKTRWRGGSNSWFDPYGEFPEAPADLGGHGTQVLGVILGGDAGGSPVGIAPGAQWIAAKIFDTRGRATISSIHLALQWVLDPDGDPATDDAPHIVNSSWASVIGLCNLEFADDLRALRAAGILPIFAAGVDGQTSPANTPEAFAVGALAGAETLSSDSPPGPSACADKPVFPQVVAPSGSVRTTDLFGTYVTLEGGTSIAAAHVSGALALLLSANPALTVEEQETLLAETAVDLGEPGPDDKFGYGRINVAAALDRLLGPDPAAHAIAVALATPPTSPNPSVPPIALIGALVVLLIGLGVVWRRRSKRSP